MRRTMKKHASRSKVARAVVRKPSTFPRHLSSTPEEWRALKRTEWRAVMHALDRYGYGSAYVPGGSELYFLQKAARRISEAIEAADWIAW